MDGAFVSFRYARQLSEHGTFALMGQTGAAEGFENPLWTALLSVLGWLSVHELRMQPHLGPALFGVLAALTTFGIATRVSRLESVCVAGLMVAASPLALSAKSGTDDLFVAVLVIAALLAVDHDHHRGLVGHRSACLLGMLSLSGLAPALLAVGLGWSHRRLLWRGVLVPLLVLIAVRWVCFSVLIPASILSKLSSFNLDYLYTTFQTFPLFIALGVAGLFLAHRAGQRVLPWVGSLVIWLVLNCFGLRTDADFGAALVPVFGVFALGLALGIETLRHRGVGIVILLAVAAVDMRIGFADRAQVAHARISVFKQAQIMTRFLRWRFDKDDLVVTQTPGILPYFLRRPSFDLTGATHNKPVDSTSVLAMGAPAMMPLGRIVSVNAERLSMGEDWDWRVVAKTHHQHALQVNAEWGLKDVPPIWFNLYMRADLPKFLPGWEAAKKAAKNAKR